MQAPFRHVQKSLLHTISVVLPAYREEQPLRYVLLRVQQDPRTRALELSYRF